jgi:hypothetical protein
MPPKRSSERLARVNPDPPPLAKRPSQPSVRAREIMDVKNLPKPTRKRSRGGSKPTRRAKPAPPRPRTPTLADTLELIEISSSAAPASGGSMALASSPGLPPHKKPRLLITLKEFDPTRTVLGVIHWVTVNLEWFIDEKSRGTLLETLNINDPFMLK